MKFFMLIMILSLQLHANFSEKENKLLSILKEDVQMEDRDVYLSGMGLQDSYMLKKEIFTLLKEGSFSLLEELLQEYNVSINLPASQIPSGQHDQEGYQGSLLVLKKKLNQYPLTKAEYTLHYAIRDNDIKKLKNILENGGLDVNKYMYNTDTPLTFAAAYGYDEIVKLLLEHGVNVDKENQQDMHMTPLVQAIHGGHLSTVSLLLEAGADITLKSGRSKITPLLHAVRSDQLEIIKYLLTKGVNVNNSHALISALWRSDKTSVHQEVIDLLIDKINVNFKPVPTTIDGEKGKKAPQTALIVAMLNGHSDATIKKLYDHGAKVGTSINEKICFLEASDHKRKSLHHKGDTNAYMKSAHQTVAAIGYNKDRDIQRRLAMVLGDAYEMSIITKKPFNKSDKKLFEKLADENKIIAAHYQMLAIFENALKKSQTNELKEWLIQYNQNMLNWCFRYLKDYAETLSPDKKDRILECVKVFEKKKC